MAMLMGLKMILFDREHDQAAVNKKKRVEFNLLNQDNDDLITK